MPSIIVGTAGHIDHGKSALVRALTGTDPDRLPEEKKRGITIDLGFADLDLGDVRIGFVDVPGHERFVKNMLAGAHGIDVLALVIAADEGVMPQTREHFDICTLLGVNAGVVVLTKRDLVDDDMLTLVEEEARELVAGSFLEHAPVIAVSSRTGQGLDQLKTSIKEVARGVPARSSDLVTRLPIDRAFSMKGFGAVVTGTLISGEIAEGNELELLPKQINVRVRGTQVHGKAVSKGKAGQRTAINLAGVDVSQLERGMVLTEPRTLQPTQIIDTKVDVLPHSSRALRSRARVRLHIGAAEVLARVRILDRLAEIKGGSSALVQLRLEFPIVAVHGDRFIIRSYSPAETIAGGIILDPLASKQRGRELEKKIKRLAELLSDSRSRVLVAFVSGSGTRGMRRESLVAATGLKAKVIEGAIAEPLREGLLVDANGVLITGESFEQLRQQLVSALALHHKREPLARGILRETLREQVFTHSPPELFGGVVLRLEQMGEIVAEKDIVRLATHSVGLSADELQLREKLENIYLKAGLEAPSIDELMTRAEVPAVQRGQARKILQLLIDGQRVIRIQNEMFIHTSVVDALRAKLYAFGAQHEPERLIDVSAFKDLAGISRKYAIPLLEYFDRERVTRRAGDKRLILKPPGQ